MSGSRDAHRRHRDQDDWLSADEPMTAAQEAYLELLCEQRGVCLDHFLTKSQASRLIEELQAPKRVSARRLR